MEVFCHGEDDLLRMAEAVGARSLNAADVFGGTWSVEEGGRGLRGPCATGPRSRGCSSTSNGWRGPGSPTWRRRGRWCGWRTAPTAGSTSTPGTAAVPGPPSRTCGRCPATGCSPSSSATRPQRAEENLVDATLHDRALPGEGELDLGGLPRGPGRHRGARPDGSGGVLRRPARLGGARRRGAVGRRHPPGPRHDASGRRREPLGRQQRAARRGRRGNRLRLLHPRPRPAPCRLRGAGPGGAEPGQDRRAGPDVRRAAWPAPRWPRRSLSRAWTPSPSPPHRTPTPRSRSRPSRRENTSCARSPSPGTPTRGAPCCDRRRAAGIVHLLGTEFRYDAGQALLAQAVRDDLVGAPRMATWIMHVPVLVDPTRWCRSGGPTRRREADGSGPTDRS